MDCDSRPQRMNILFFIWKTSVKDFLTLIAAPSAPQRCRPGEYTCETGQCINQNRRCDQRVDCQDGSDEKNSW